MKVLSARLFKELRNRMLIGVTGLAVKLLWLTVRFDVVGFERVVARGWPDPGVIFVFWHETLLLPLGHRCRRNCRVVVSAGRDGDFAARVLRRWFGVGAYRGSTSRRAQAVLLEMVRGDSVGISTAFTPDGPRGPRRHFHPGPAVLASRTGRPVVAIGGEATRAWRLRSWDRMLIPRPFSRVAIEFGPPVEVPPDLRGAELVAWTERLRNTLQDTNARAARRIGKTWQAEPAS